MNTHDHTIIALVTRFLDRKATPRRLEGKPLAQEDECDAICEAVKHSAPRNSERFTLWWPVFQRRLSEQCGPSWPTEKEIKQTAEEATASLPKPPAPSRAAAQESHYTLIAAKINSQEAVGEGCLYGVEAVELIKRNLVNRETMTRYREAAYFARARQYGEEAALKWKAEREAIHQSAWDSYDEIHREQNELDSLRIRPLPYKPNYAA